jgi:vacuolar iron transporter family protein
MQREVHAVLGPVGVDEKVSRQVADSLLALEDERAGATAAAAEETNAVQRRPWTFGKSQARRESDDESGLRWSEDVGLTAFLLKFGEGMGKRVVRFDRGGHV